MLGMKVRLCFIDQNDLFNARLLRGGGNTGKAGIPHIKISWGLD
jgi:hypothetical protein